MEATLRQHFEIRELHRVRIIMATVAAHYTPGQMLWVWFTGPGLSERTELLSAIAVHPDCAETEVLTPAAFRGGFKKGPKLLDRIAGKLVITKDIVAILAS